ncbi:MAG: hypothetical protein ACHQNV_08330 [Vicinamibacteria bacterium]
MSGAVEAGDDALAVQVDLKNGGETAASTLSVEGELLGTTAQVQVPAGVPAGTTRSVILKFPANVPRPGVHPLSLLLDYTSPGPRGPVAVSQRAYLLLGLGDSAEPAVRLTLPEVHMDYSGLVPLGIESADAAAHTVRVRLQGPRGFRADNPPEEVRVPARGALQVPIRVFRGTLPWGSPQGMLVIAESTDGPVASTAVGTGIALISPDPAWMPRLRKPILAAAIVLLVLTAGLEAWRRLS